MAGGDRLAALTISPSAQSRPALAGVPAAVRHRAHIPFRLCKQRLRGTCPEIRSPEAADRWTWLILAAFTELRLARPLAADLRRPWEKAGPPDRLTPARVGRDSRHLRPKAACPAEAPKSSRHPAKRRTKKSATPHPAAQVKDQASGSPHRRPARKGRPSAAPAPPALECPHRQRRRRVGP
jgi:hypothetical protein